MPAKVPKSFLKNFISKFVKFLRRNKFPQDIQALIKELYEGEKIALLKKTEKPPLGMPIMFVYDPKLKAKLPFYDVLFF